MLNNIKIKKIPEFLVKNYFNVCLILAIFSIALGGFLLCKYKILPKFAEIYSSEEKYVDFEEKNFKKILNQLNKQEKEFIDSNLEITYNPFK